MKRGISKIDDALSEIKESNAKIKEITYLSTEITNLTDNINNQILKALDGLRDVVMEMENGSSVGSISKSIDRMRELQDSNGVSW